MKDIFMLQEGTEKFLLKSKIGTDTNCFVKQTGRGNNHFRRKSRSRRTGGSLQMETVISWKSAHSPGKKKKKKLPVIKKIYIYIILSKSLYNSIHLLLHNHQYKECYVGTTNFILNISWLHLSCTKAQLKSTFKYFFGTTLSVFCTLYIFACTNDMLSAN